MRSLIVANGIRYTVMPAFAETHSPDDIWQSVLWIRYVANLTTEERAGIAREMHSEKRHHEGTMERGTRTGP